MKRWLPLGLIAVGVVLGIYALFFSSSEEDRIRERLVQLADAVRVDDRELNPLVRHGRLRKEFAEIFTKEAHVSVPEVRGRLSGRDELVAAATQAATVYQSAEVSFGDAEIRVDPAGVTAEVNATATVSGARHGQAVRRDELPVAIQLEKLDGDWKITSAKVERQERGDEGL